MARTSIDIGPTANFSIPGSEAAIPNIAVSVAVARGPILISCNVEINHGGLGTGETTVRLWKNTDPFNNTERTIRMIGPDRAVVVMDAIDPSPAVGDVWQIAVFDSIVDPLNVIPAGKAYLLFDAISKDAVTCSEVAVAAA